MSSQSVSVNDLLAIIVMLPTRALKEEDNLKAIHLTFVITLLKWNH